MVGVQFLAALAMQDPASPPATAPALQPVSLVCRGVGFDNEDIALQVRVGGSQDRRFALRFEGMQRQPGVFTAQRFKVAGFTTHLTEGVPFVHEDYLFSAGDETFRFLLTRYLLSDRVIGRFYLAPGDFDPFRGYMAAGTCRQATTPTDLRDATADEALVPHRAVDPGQMGFGEMPIATTWNCEVVDEAARRHTGVVVFGAGREPSARLTFGDGAVGQVFEAGSRLFLTYRYTGNHINTFSALTEARTGREVHFLGMPMIGWLSVAPGPDWNRGRAGHAGPLAGRCAYLPARSANGNQGRQGQ